MFFVLAVEKEAQNKSRKTLSGAFHNPPELLNKPIFLEIDNTLQCQTPNLDGAFAIAQSRFFPLFFHRCGSSSKVRFQDGNVPARSSSQYNGETSNSYKPSSSESH